MSVTPGRAVGRLHRPSGVASDRERVEHLFMLYERMVKPLLAAKPKRRRRRTLGHTRVIRESYAFHTPGFAGFTGLELCLANAYFTPNSPTGVLQSESHADFVCGKNGMTPGLAGVEKGKENNG